MRADSALTGLRCAGVLARLLHIYARRHDWHSAGADAVAWFANQYLANDALTGRILGMAFIGATSEINDNTYNIGDLYNLFSSMIGQGTRIYIMDDGFTDCGNNCIDGFWGQTLSLDNNSLRYVQEPNREHYQGGNAGYSGNGLFYGSNTDLGLAESVMARISGGG